MAVDTYVPYTTKEGIEYLIQFILFEEDKVPDDINLPIVDIVIQTNADFSEINNNISSLLQISKIICDYMNEHDAVYYCYCSEKPIKRHKNKSHLSHQEYRSQLFCALFDKQNNTDFISKVVIIEDSMHNIEHYIHLISKSEHENSIDIISEKLSAFDK